MSADKFQSVHEALADVFNAPHPNATDTGSSHTAIDHETLSEAFSEPRPNEVGTHRSLARLDHATLAGMFSEPSSEIQTTFDEAFSEILSERPQLATDTQVPRPGFDHEMVAEMLTERPTISANTKPSQPSFDHQALAEMLTEARADPMDPPTYPLNFDTEPPSSSALFSSQVQQARPATQAFAASALTTAEGAPKAKSLFAKLHQIFSTKEEPELSDVQKDTLSRSLAGQLHTLEPTAQAISPSAQDPQQHNLLLAEQSPLSFEQEPKSSQPSHPPGSAKAVESDVAVTYPTDAANAWPLHATSPVGELSSPGLEPPAKTTSFAPLANAESAAMRSPETPRWPNEILTPDSTDADSQSFIFQNGSTTIDSDQTTPQESATRIVATVVLPDAEGAGPQEAGLPASLIAGNGAFDATPDSAEVAAEPALPLPTRAVTTRPQTKLLLPTAAPELDSADNKSPLPIIERGLPSPSLPNRPVSAVPSVKSVFAAHPTEAEDAPPQLSGSLLAALHVLNTKPSPPVVEKAPSRTKPASQVDRAGVSAKSVSDPKEAGNSLARQAGSLLTEVHTEDSTYSKSLAPISKNEPSSSPISNRPTDVAQTANAVAVTHPADTENAVERVERAKMLLADLDLNTAIHLRWVMRDIRSRRTKFSPVSANDLKALMDLGLVEIREELPRLTGLGLLELD